MIATSSLPVAKATGAGHSIVSMLNLRTTGALAARDNSDLRFTFGQLLNGAVMLPSGDTPMTVQATLSPGFGSYIARRRVG